MNTKYYLIGGACLVVVLFLALSATNILAGKPSALGTASVNTNTYSGNAGSSGNSATGDVQVVNMHVEGSRYIYEPATVVKGIPVRIVADISRMPGCSKGYTIREYGINKYVSQGDNTVEFTPTKTGQINTACTMNMYTGVLNVVDSAGQNTASVTTAGNTGPANTQNDAQAVSLQNNNAAPASRTCGANGGGCGCMG